MSRARQSAAPHPPPGGDRIALGKKRKAVELLAEGKLNRKAIAEQIGVHPRTLGSWLKDTEFLAAFHEEFQAAQCRDLQTLHLLLQGAYEEFLKRLSREEIGEVSTLHLVQLMDRLHRQLKEIQGRLSKMSKAGGTRPDAPPLLSEEEYHELAQQILERLAQRPEGSQAPGSE